MNKPQANHPVIAEAMRIGGQKVTTEEVVPVHYPYTGRMIGTVPAGPAEPAARDIANAKATPKAR